jgi:enamine deaminase RidA (YjgF/YER057c/UK114 family)
MGDVETPAESGHEVSQTATVTFSGAAHTLRTSELDDRQLEPMLAHLARGADRGPDPGADAAGHLLKATVYLRDLAARDRARAQLAAIGGHTPSIELTVAPPVSGAAAAVFEWRIGGPGVALDDGRPGRPGRPGCIAQPGADWQFSAVDLLRGADEPVTEQFHAAMASARAGLPDGLDDAELASTLIRTWIYVGDINGRTGPIENYQAVNHARRSVFAELALPRPGSGLPYPASTGIGTAARLLTLGLLTCRDRGGGIRAVALENPRQTSAFAYPRSASEIPPLFSRAVALCAPREAIVLISGTASIVEARSVHVESAAHQTRQTLANIGELLEPAVLVSCGFRAAAGGLGALRGCIVYIKRAADVAAVRAVCSRILPPELPAVFVLADVCRPELLVEIEAIAAVPREGFP